jgi:uncharacterized protein (TIGR02145 family)
MELSLNNNLIDYSGVVYPTINIGQQRWLSKNLGTRKFLNGDPIPLISDPSEWENCGESGKPACCFFDNNTSLDSNFGLLYNWFAVIDPRGIAPSGTRIPLISDWMQLIETAGGEHIAGRKLKNISGWNNGGNGINQFGFSAMPGGGRGIFGDFLDLGDYANWWTPEDHDQEASFVYITFSNSNFFIRRDGFKASGLSVRCILKSEN